VSVPCRIAAFILGDQVAAEAFQSPAEEPLPSWIVDNSTSPEILGFALRLSIASAEAGRTAVESLERKAAATLNLLLAIAPASVVVTLASATRWHDVRGVVAFSTLALAVIALMIALLIAAVAAGPRTKQEPSLRNIVTTARPLPSGPVTEQYRELQLREIAQFQASAWSAIHITTSLAWDLFLIRRLAIVGVFLLVIGAAASWA
jgi:hypothetical protein